MAPIVSRPMVPLAPEIPTLIMKGQPNICASTLCWYRAGDGVGVVHASKMRRRSAEREQIPLEQHQRQPQREVQIPNASRIEPTITAPSTKTRSHGIWLVVEIEMLLQGVLT